MSLTTTSTVGVSVNTGPSEISVHQPGRNIHIKQRKNHRYSVILLDKRTARGNVKLNAGWQHVYIRNNDSSSCSANLPSFHDLCTEADRNLCYKVLSYPNHHLLPLVSSISQTLLRPRAHSRVLLKHSTRLIDCNSSFVYYTMKYIDTYRISLTVFYYSVVHFWIFKMFNCILSTGHNKWIIIIYH